ncbi:malate dehydrogenase, cytoplasmic-like [Phymastichus coffea]|uniref:malate dehydrogenase, cytoplasmic-like n=1 Tax=Phymastichus coffea TaxID=108790 RepID=UPI00273AC91F|nr:malate dehydrogenase, cytoplasmic-like [Phymastichus coffea]
MDQYKFKSNLTVFRKTLQNEDKPPLRVVITEAMSYTSRSLAYRLLSDEVFGSDQEIILSFFDTSDSVVFLEGIVIEITACAPNLLRDIIHSKEESEAFKDADYIFSIGKARDYNFFKTDLKGDQFFQDAVLETKSNALAIEKYAKKDAKVITLGNTAATLISEYAPSIPKENITAVSLALQKSAATAIAKKMGRVPSDVSNLIIWGTNSRQNFPYCNYAKFKDGKSVMKEVDDDVWLRKELPEKVEATFQKCRYRTSDALALAEHCKLLIQGTPPGKWTCMSVYSDGSYGVTPRVFFSFPVTCENGCWKIVQGLYVEGYCKQIIADFLAIINEKITIALKISQRPVSPPLFRKSVRKSIIKISQI